MNLFDFNGFQGCQRVGKIGVAARFHRRNSRLPDRPDFAMRATTPKIAHASS
jgi:hypothetical protein